MREYSRFGITGDDEPKRESGCVTVLAWVMFWGFGFAVCTLLFFAGRWLFLHR